MLVRILITTRTRLNYTQDMTELWVNSVTYERSDFPSGFCCYDSFRHRHVGSNISVVILPTVHAAKSEIYLKQSAYDFNVPMEDAKHIKCVMHREYQYGFRWSVSKPLALKPSIAHCAPWQGSDVSEECTTPLSTYWKPLLATCKQHSCSTCGLRHPAKVSSCVFPL